MTTTQDIIMNSEEFIINDILLNVNPSDIQVLDDNYLQEESFLRSKAVYCFRSKYSSSKVVMTIPFQITNFKTLSPEELENTTNCIKLVTELNNYPFCFIKSNRLNTYVSPLNMSSTGYMMYAVDEIALVSNSKAGNIMFLELVLQYFNHSPFVQNFNFKDNLSSEKIVDDKGNETIINNVGSDVVNSLNESTVWKKYMKPKFKRAMANLVESKLLTTLEDTTNIHPLMSVRILAPFMTEINEAAVNIADGSFIRLDSKVVTVSDLDNNQQDEFEQMLTTLNSQDFSQIKTNDDKQAKNKKDIFIQWSGKNLESLNVTVQSIEVRKKNKLVSHTIGTNKHPIIQFFGSYPTQVNISTIVPNHEGFIDESGITSFIKHTFNILDYNRKLHPEAEGYNYLRVQSLGTILLGNDAYLPGQSQVVASSSQQGIENVIYTFSEGDLSSFIEMSKVEGSGKNSISKFEKEAHQLIIDWLIEFDKNLIGNRLLSKDAINFQSEQNNTYAFSIYQSVISLSDAISKEFNLLNKPRYLATVSSLAYKDEIKLNNNLIIDDLNLIPKDKIFGFDLYSKSFGSVTKDVALFLADPLTSRQENRKKGNISLSLEELIKSYIPYITHLLATRKLLLEGKAIKDKDITFRPSAATDFWIKDILTKIELGSKAQEKISTSIATIPKNLNLLEVLKDRFGNSFYGQAIPDILLEDLLDTEYNETTDTFIQNINPFFFIQEETVLNMNVLSEYYSATTKENINRQVESVLETSGREDADPKKASEIIGVKYRDLIEVDRLGTNPDDVGRLNPDSAPSYQVVTKQQIKGVQDDIKRASERNPPSVQTQQAIERALVRYNLQNNQAFRNYMYATLYAETSNGHIQSSSTGTAQGLFQFLPSAVAAIVQSNHSVEGLTYKNVPESKRYEVARELLKKEVFKDPYINAQAFIEYIKVTRKQLKSNGIIPQENQNDPLFSYATHNIGANGASALYTYMNTGVLPNSALILKIKNQLGKEFKRGGDKEVVEQYINKYSTIFASVTAPPSAFNKKAATFEEGTQKDILNSNRTINKDLNINQNLSAKVVKALDGKTVSLKFSDGSENIVELYGIREASETSNTLSKLALNKDIKVSVKGFKGSTPIVTANLADGTDIGLSLIKQGVVSVEHTVKNTTYSKAELEAKNSKIGMWNPQIIEEAKKPVPKPTTPKISYSDIQATKDKSIINNNFQPFANGQTFPISSPFSFGRIRAATGTIHYGVDFGCPGGTDIIAPAKGVVAVASNNVRGYGIYIEIDHQNGFRTRYGHLSKLLVRTGQEVVAGAVIGKSGNTGHSIGKGGGYHLHYEVRYNGVAINPFSTLPLTRYSGTADIVNNASSTRSAVVTTDGDPIYTPPSHKYRLGVNESNSVYNESNLVKAIFNNINKYTNVGLQGAFPAINVYITVGNESDNFWLDNLKGGIQYYQLKGLKSVHINTNNDENPVDVAVLTVADPSYLNSDLYSIQSKTNQVNIDKIGTDFETNFINNRLKVLPGMKLHIRMGYGNDVNNLEIVFNGIVVEIDNVNSQTLQIVCESFGKELLSEIYNPTEPLKSNNQSNSSTSSVIGNSLLSKSIMHFGHNPSYLKALFGEETDPENRELADGFLGLSYKANFDFSKANLRSRLYINTFAPELEVVDDVFRSYASGFFKSITNLNMMAGYPFYIWRMTPWDCLKQMEYRHPAAIAKPMIYEDRMTFFFGVKEQMYFAQDISKNLMGVAAGSEGMSDIAKSEYSEKRTLRMKPVSNIHIVTSETNLISNGLKLNSRYSTTTNVSYFTDNDEFSDETQWDNTKMSIDDDLNPYDIREKQLSLSGCHGPYVSFLYGTADLKKECEKMYSGKIFIVGNPSMKSGDYIFIDDNERKLYGFILVRECIHHFDDQNGFVTEITPGQYVEPAHFMYSSLWLRLLATCKVGTASMKLKMNSTFNKDFEIVSDYLKILQQLSAANEKEPYDETGKLPYVINYGIVGLLTLVLQKTYRLLGIERGFKFGTKSAILGSNLIKFTYTALVSTLSTFFREISLLPKLVNSGEKLLGSTISNHIRTGVGIGSNGVKWAASSKVWQTGGRLYTTAAGKLSNLSAVKALKSGLVFRTGSATLSIATATALASTRAAASASIGIIQALAVSNPVGIALDVIFMIGMAWATAQIEKTTLTRQPLLFFPLLKHGKPYVGGMSGVTRNSYTNSLLLQASKTIKEVQKAAEIISANAEAKGQSGIIVSALDSIGGSNGKPSIPLYSKGAYNIDSKEINVLDKSKQPTIDNKKYDISYNSDEEIRNVLLKYGNDINIMNNSEGVTNGNI